MWRTTASLPAALNRIHTHGSSPPEKGLCPAPGMRRGGGNCPFSWNFCSCYFQGKKKKKSGATSASLSYTSGQLTDSWDEVIWTQLPSHKTLSPKGSASSSRLRLPLAPAQAGLPGPELSPTRYFCHPPLHPTGSFLPFLLPSQTLVWFF